MGEHTYTSIDAALRSIDVHHSADELVTALRGHDIPVSVWQVYRWKRDVA